MDRTTLDQASRVLEEARDLGLRVVCAESCTGGLIAAYLTAIAGSSDVFERGFVTYTNEAKIEMLGVDANSISTEGAVSEVVARAMAEGAMLHSPADAAIAVTGIAGPGGGSDDKPVGLVHIACARGGHPTTHQKCLFGDQGRDRIRLLSVAAALDMLVAQIRRPLTA